MEILVTKNLFSLIIWIFLITGKVNGQTKVYCFPGQGANSRIFDRLKLDTSLFDIQIIEYDKYVKKHSSMKSVALEISKQMDTNNNFVFLGVSLGGMICAELSEILNPSKTIIISSAKNRKELPFRYRLQKTIPLILLVPGFLIKKAAITLQPIIEPDARTDKFFFSSMLKAKTSEYMKNSVKLILKWKRKSNNSKIYHIHGNNDHTIPIRNIKNADRIIKNGSHMMTYTKAREISSTISEILTQ